MKLTVDGETYDAFAKPNNKTVIAFEAAMGCTYLAWTQKLRTHFKEVGEQIKAARALVPEGTDPDLSNIDVSMSGVDSAALVFLARRHAGEDTLAFSDVDFTDLALVPDDDDAEPEEESPPPDRNADPTDGSPTTVSEPPAESSPLTV